MQSNSTKKKTHLRQLKIVVGQCNTKDKYGHNFLYCPNCNVDKSLRCTITNCLCNGNAYLFHAGENCYSHQIVGHPNSIRIYTDRPKRAIEAISKGIDKSLKISKPKSRSREGNKIKQKLNEFAPASKKAKLINVVASMEPLPFTVSASMCNESTNESVTEKLTEEQHKILDAFLQNIDCNDNSENSLDIYGSSNQTSDFSLDYSLNDA